MSTDSNSQETIPSWRVLEEIGAGDGVPTECERCGKPALRGSSFNTWA